jgi:cytochrome bd-type quinol oxidase subunit 1
MVLALIRIVAVIVGTSFFIPAFPIALFGFRENVWLVVVGLLNGLFGAWLVCAGWCGTLSGRQPNA